MKSESIARLYSVTRRFEVGLKLALAVSFIGDNRGKSSLNELNEAHILPEYVRSVRDIGAGVNEFINSDPNATVVEYHKARLGTLLTLTEKGKLLYEQLWEVK